MSQYYVEAKDFDNRDRSFISERGTRAEGEAVFNTAVGAGSYSRIELRRVTDVMAVCVDVWKRKLDGKVLTPYL